MGDFVIVDGVLTEYKGNDEHVFIPENVVKIAKGAFAHNNKIVQVTMNEQIEEVGCMAFALCTRLKAITFPQKKVVLMERCFYKCVSLESVVLPRCTSVPPGLFMYCTSLKTLDIPDSVRKICRSAFKRCDALRSLQLPASVESVSSFAFSRCTQLRVITCMGEHCPLGNESVIKSKTVIALPNTKYMYDEAQEGFLITGDGVLERYVGISPEIRIPESVKKIADYAFCRNRMIRKVWISGSVEEVGHHVFAGCRNLEEVTVERGVRRISSCMCIGCTNLTGLSLSDGIEYIGDNVICGCQRIKEISFPDSVENAAQITACYGLERIRYSRKVRELPYNSVISCPKLKRIELADETEIGLRAIVDCENAEIVRYS